MKYFLTIITFLLVISHQNILAQGEFRILNSEETIQNAYELSEEDPDKAISELLKIHESDSNYLSGQIAILEILEENDRHDQQLELAQKLLKKPTEKNLEILLHLCRGLTNKNLYDSSLVHLEKAKETYPFDPTVHYLIALNQIAKDEIELAIENLILSIRCNPYFQSSHLLLGKLMILQGNKTRALFCLETYLALNPSDLSALRLLENCLNHAVSDEKTVRQIIPHGDLHELELIVRSKAALDERFKSRFDLGISTTRQTELVFELLPAKGDGKDFWFEFYIPFYQDLKNKGLEEAFIYHILRGVESEEVIGWLNKNEKTHDAFLDAANTFIDARRHEMIAKVYPGRYGDRQFWYYDNNTLNAIGNQIDDETYIGPWVFYYDNGEKQLEGSYTDEGQYDGKWKFYARNGQLSSMTRFKNGERTDTTLLFYDNGSRREITPYSNGVINGDVTFFYRYNLPSEILTYKDGKRQGKGATYFVTGHPESEYTFVNDSLDGKHTLYYKNGQVNETEYYKRGKSEGEFTAYYPTGNIYQKGQNIDGAKDGKWISYHENGTLEFEGELKNDKKIGTWKYFNDKKLLTDVEVYDDEGKKTGTWESFYDDGTKYLEFYYKDDLPTGYKYFDSKGKVLSEASDENGNFPVTYFHKNGQKSFEGYFKNGLLDGAFTSYYHTGQIKIKGIYEEGELEGEFTEYYETGEIDKVIAYQDGYYHGPYIEYHKNGNIEVDGYVIEGLSQNLWRYYYPNGTISVEYFFVDNEPHGLSIDYAVDGSKMYEFDYDYGVVTSYRAYDSLEQLAYSHDLPFGTGKYVYTYSNGQKSLEKNVVAGDPVGQSLAYYKSGQLRELKNHKNGLLEGKYEYYLRNGQLRTEGQFFNDELSGLWTRYYENGNKRNEGSYLKGEEDGLWKYYYENGTLESSAEFKNGEKDGVNTYYDIDGKSIAVEKTYTANEDIKYRHLKSDGQWCETKTLKNGTGTIEAYYQNGNKSLIHEYFNGKLHGKQIEYYANGNLKEEFYLEKGDYHGDYTRYYPSGKKIYVIPYQYDMIHGTYREYYESGKLKAEIHYVMDEKHGWEIQYNEDGSVKEKIYYWNGLEY